MARHCGTCYYDAEPGDEKCRRCSGEFEVRDLTWLIMLSGLCGIALVSGIVGYYLGHL